MNSYDFDDEYVPPPRDSYHVLMNHPAVFLDAGMFVNQKLYNSSMLCESILQEMEKHDDIVRVSIYKPVETFTGMGAAWRWNVSFVTERSCYEKSFTVDRTGWSR